VRETTTVARNIGIRLDPVLVGGPADFEQAFAMMAKNQTQAVIVQGLFDSHRRMIIELAAKQRLASMFSFRENIVAGGLISYGSSQPDLLKRAAVYVDKILKGAKPAHLPVEQPSKFELVISISEPPRNSASRSRPRCLLLPTR
jgi:putative ABC transport system substrate-binding protein